MRALICQTKCVFWISYLWKRGNFLKDWAISLFDFHPYFSSFWTKPRLVFSEWILSSLLLFPKEFINHKKSLKRENRHYDHFTLFSRYHSLLFHLQSLQPVSRLECSLAFFFSNTNNLLSTNTYVPLLISDFQNSWLSANEFICLALLFF